MANLNTVTFTGENEIDLEGLRTRLQKMSDLELLRFGYAAKSMCSPDAHCGNPQREVFVIQLEEARRNWNEETQKRDTRDDKAGRPHQC